MFPCKFANIKRSLVFNLEFDLDFEKSKISLDTILDLRGLISSSRKPKHLGLDLSHPHMRVTLCLEQGKQDSVDFGIVL